MADQNAYDAQLMTSCTRYGVPFALAKAVMIAESGGNPRAWRIEPKLAKIDGQADGSRGLFQIIGKTARAMGYRGPLGDDALHAGGLYDPATSIDLGVKYLRDLLHSTGNVVEDTISAYNGGIRPSLGYGKKATKAGSVCNAYDKNGNCIDRRNVAVGEYANQPYVNRVAALFRTIEKAAGSAASAAGAAVSSPTGRASLSVVLLLALLGAVLWFTTHAR